MPTRINGELLDENEVLEEERSILPRLAEAMRGESRAAITSRAREWARDNVIDRVLLRQATANDPELTTRLTAKLIPPKQKDLIDYYRRNSAQLFLPDMVRAAHIVRNVDEKTPDAEARAAIDSIAARLAAGADFAQVADEHSDCPGRGGDLGFFPRGQMVSEFDHVVFDLEPGRISDVFRTPFGYHIARVIETRPAGVPKFDLVRERIAEILYAEKRQRAIDRFIDQLRAKATIETA
jgi:parvulin-like peptidyl-prolyl isomerase